MKILKIEFTNHPILKNLSFDFQVDGHMKDITLLVGENGCGKTLFLEEIFKIVNGGIIPWNDKIGRRITVKYSEEERAAFSLPDCHLVIDYDESRGTKWTALKILDINGNDLTPQHHAKFQQNDDKNPGKQFKCAYSTVEINFAVDEIAAIKASSTDETKKPKSKSSVNIATEIAQLLVDIKTQDDAALGRWMRENQGKTVKVECPEGKLDRFKKAYLKMFEGKELFEIRAHEGKHKIIFKDLEESVEFGISGLSSGEKQVVYRMGYLLRDLKHLAGGMILIDEPELSLHPRWQIKYIDFIRDIFFDGDEEPIQFVIATHSPYFLKSSSMREVGVATFTRKKGNIVIERPDEHSWSLLSHGPTLGEINYYAFKLPSIEFHNDLYAYLQEQNSKPKILDIENWFVSKGQTKEKKWRDSTSGQQVEETLITCIRNKIHHGDNQDRPDFSNAELEDSIRRMIKMIT
ncbi:ATP-binding protein [Candidatus Peregrinibacteria bacterium]|nr:ATP-binding protein [Candidatus Peregrinibacteria bacterium]